MMVEEAMGYTKKKMFTNTWTSNIEKLAILAIFQHTKKLIFNFSFSGSCGAEGCNEKGCHGYQQGRHGLIDTDEIISCSVYEV